MLVESKEAAVKTFGMLMPSVGCGMLLKCIANSDALLPLASSLCIQKESEKIQSEVESLLLKVVRNDFMCLMLIMMDDR